jgi:NMD protein affecting ribosome stability and mRNA decay
MADDGNCPQCGIPQNGNGLCAECQKLQDDLKKEK